MQTLKLKTLHFISDGHADILEERQFSNLYGLTSRCSFSGGNSLPGKSSSQSVDEDVLLSSESEDMVYNI